MLRVVLEWPVAYMMPCRCLQETYQIGLRKREADAQASLSKVRQGAWAKSDRPASCGPGRDLKPPTETSQRAPSRRSFRSIAPIFVRNRIDREHYGQALFRALSAEDSVSRRHERTQN